MAKKYVYLFTPFKAFDTVEIETPASFATSFIEILTLILLE